MLRVRFVLRWEGWLKVGLALTEARLFEVHLFDTKMQRHKLFSCSVFRLLYRLASVMIFIASSYQARDAKDGCWWWLAAEVAACA